MTVFETPYALPSEETVAAITPEYVARWLLDEIAKRGGAFAEQTAALEIARLFDGRFVHSRTSGEFAVRSNVVKALRQIAGKRLRWDHALRGWRLAPVKARATKASSE